VKKVIVHLSHTDIRSDSRILKQLNAIKSIPGIDLHAIGIKSSGDQGKQILNSGFQIRSVKLFSKFLPKWPRLVRHFFNFLELHVLFLIHLIRLKPKVVHCHDTTVLPIGVIIKIIFNSKLIYDAHELESNRNGQSRVLSKCVYILEWLFWGNIDHFITVSQTIIDWYTKEFGNKSNIVVLNSPEIVNKNSSQFDSNYLRDLFMIKDSERIFIYLGIIGYGRGIEMYLDVFANRVKAAHVVFIGYGEFVDKVKKYASIYNNIHYHEPVDHNQVVHISKSADFGLCFIENVSLSDYYCLPNKLFEYTFAGLKILGSNFPEIKKVIDEYGLGYSVEPSAESIAFLINNLDVKDEKLLRNKDLFPLTWEAQSAKLVELYLQILNKKK
jgi:glycosyltransferase involved in cell wall biosynthesis